MKLAFVFPGQGSQAVGMLSDLAREYSIIADTFQEASTILGYDLWELAQQGPESELNHSPVTQPAMLAAGVAVWRVWEQLGGPKPSLLAGHSLGEYSAYVCAGSLSFVDAIALVSARGKFMQEAVPQGEGAMAAILGLADDIVQQACEAVAGSEVVTAVNFNSEGQVVIAGHSAAVSRAVSECQSRGAKKAILLPVSVPSHCQLMDPAAHQLAERLQLLTLHAPAIPVINNVDVDCRIEAADIKDTLTRQLCNPVRWVETIRKMHAEGVTDIIECGPGKVLAGLIKRIEREINAHPVFSPDSLDKAMTAVRR